jgi:hypothetical protein
MKGFWSSGRVLWRILSSFFRSVAERQQWRGRASVPEQELERAQAALTQFVGPIARVLVRRAAANASSVEVLWQALSTRIDSPAERSAFLRQRPN